MTQVLSNGIVNYIHFASKSFNETQQCWGVGEREAFAVVWACETFERYIKGIFTTVYTDNKNFNWMSSSINSKILRWEIRLQDFNIEIEYIAGEENSICQPPLPHCARYSTLVQCRMKLSSLSKDLNFCGLCLRM